VGHHFRNLQIVRALAQTHEVHFVDGGRRIPGADAPESVKLIRLAPIFLTPQGLAPEDPTRHIEEVMEERRRTLSGAIRRLCPDVFLIEFFPFDRWMLRPELEPAIEAARSVNRDVKVICSLRDIPARARTAALTSSPAPEALRVGDRLRFYSVPSGGRRRQDISMAGQYYREVVPTLNACFDALLVHADPRISRLEDCFPWVDDIAIPVVYTGYVAEKRNGERHLSGQSGPEDGRKFVLVSAGGGLDGYELAVPCIEAWNRLQEGGAVEGREMVIFSGLFVEDAHYEALRRMCADGPFRLERFAPDFLRWMQGADLSISRAGYNTCMNALETRTRALLVPSRLSEDQALRARKLAEMGLAEVLSPDVLTPHRIAGAILRGLSQPPVDHDLALDGAEQTCAFITNL
jgi:predicted glycosyltransferase